jgi:hypothetical protein
MSLEWKNLAQNYVNWQDLGLVVLNVWVMLPAGYYNKEKKGPQNIMFHKNKLQKWQMHI